MRQAVYAPIRGETNPDILELAWRKGSDWGCRAICDDTTWRFHANRQLKHGLQPRLAVSVGVAFLHLSFE